MTNSIKSFGGVQPPSFLIIERVTPHVLPASRIKTMTIPMQDGERLIDKTLGIRTFRVDVAIKAPKNKTVLDCISDLAAWLHTKGEEELILSDRPDVSYMATVDSAGDIDRFSKSGKGTITFVCLSGHGFSNDKKVYDYKGTNSDPVTMIYNQGTKATYPVLKLKFAKDVTEFAITTDNDHLFFGEPTNLEAEVKDENPLIFNEEMNSFANWTNAVSIDGGNVMGTFETSGNSFRQADEDYGVGSSWHGASMIRSFDTPAQDFKAECFFGFNASDKSQIGRVEMYVLDTNGIRMGKVALKDVTVHNNFPLFEARAGTLQNGEYFVSNNDTADVWLYQNFYGKMRIERKGIEWKAYIGKYSAKLGKFHSQMTRKLKDKDLKYNQQVGGIQIHIGVIGEHEPVKDMYIVRTRAYEYDEAAPEEIPFIFKAGDELIIDNVAGEIFLNGEEVYDSLYPSSSFLKFDKGYNGISFSDPSAVTAATIEFEERWLF